ncbi:major facilitator superfamily domain-containing protein [Durotheca rogersii]|uniref:major facilitator superfamily domain-containing protein n=1 Tax=Durotheca rogersii TaxID=419775 RepID=UPI00221FF20F|nr:major facilitator superfamily domain-containing protein [Durotheca rogersii]KAI5855583.1 major facilitator superfamily domain-containing protein [Durotheca rogersii]
MPASSPPSSSGKIDEGPPPSTETTPLLGPGASVGSDSLDKSLPPSNGTFNAPVKDGAGRGRGLAVPDDGEVDVEAGSVDDIDAAAAMAGDGDNGKPPLLKVNLAALLPALAIGIFLVAMDQTLTIATYGKIGSDLAALNSTGWISTSYFLTLTALQPLYGRLSDTFGRRASLMFAYAVFGIGCLGCGLARDIAQLCTARAVAGAGGGGMNAVVSILVTDLVPLRDRALWQGYINVIFAAGVAVGAPLGGVLADGPGWRWAFLAQCPLAAAAWVAVYLTLSPPAPSSTDGDDGDIAWLTKLCQVDFLGAAILVAAVAALLVGLDGGSNLGWSRWATVGPLAASPALFAAFALVEARWAWAPFAPARIVLDGPLFAAYAANLLGVAAQMGVLFFIALYFQAAAGLSAARAGLVFIPSTAAGLTGSLGAGFVIRRTGKYYALTLFSYALLVLSVPVLLAFTGAVADSTAGVVVGISILSLGSGIFITSTLIAIIANAAEDDKAIAIACSYLFRSLGTSLGISTSTAVLQQALRAGLEAAAPALGGGDRAREIERRVRRSLDAIRELDPPVAAVVRACYSRAVRCAFVPVAILAAAALVAALFIREKRLEDGRREEEEG